jgi:hypothetical protein
MFKSLLSQKMASKKTIYNTIQLARFGGMTGMASNASHTAVEHFQLWETPNRSGILITVHDKPG